MSTGSRPRVVLLRGHQLNSWHLRPWRHLTDRYQVTALRTRSNWFDTGAIGIETREVRALRDLLPPGRAGQMLSRIPGDRYLDLVPELTGAEIVHSQDLGFWYSMQAARHRKRLGYKLVLTVWETIPFLDAYRNVRTRPYRKLALAETDLFLAATERARMALLLEGAPEERIRICPPGVDLELFAMAAAPASPPAEHLVVSFGRLVWEKGHQDLLRAVAALRRGILPGARAPRVLIVGAGPERGRLARYAGELGIDDLVEIRAESPYAEMPSLYARASCLVLGSLQVWSWEEQFGMVLVEALAAGLPIAAAASGAIPEVLRGQGRTFPPGDWPALARLLAEGPLSRPPGERVSYEPELVEEYSSVAFADRLAAAYADVLAR
ncbi:MAG: glycosyltransferase [Thermoleophilaceae bacterium]|nr:glycosyltransferase [Thermoleophilaceae bacterium]